MRLRRALWALSVVALGALPLAAQETAKADKPVKRDEVIRRAYTRARQSEDRTLLRLTLAPNEDATVVAVAEYGTGDIGIFVGGSESKDDMFAIVDLTNAAIFEEALKRSATKRPWGK